MLTFSSWLGNFLPRHLRFESPFSRDLLLRLSKGQGSSYKCMRKARPAKRKNGSRLIRRVFLLLLVLSIIFVWTFHDPILLRAGKFLAPQENGAADVTIVEGGEIVQTGGVKEGLKLLLSKRASRLILIVHGVPDKVKPFGLNEDYPQAVEKELRRMGLKEEQFSVMVTPVQHPITLTEAKIVLERLSGEGVRSAILLSPAFHTRRSFLVYRSVATPLRIKMIPWPYFTDFQLNGWWNHDLGFRDFFAEFFKLAYYKVRYLPLTSF